MTAIAGAAVGVALGAVVAVAAAVDVAAGAVVVAAVGAVWLGAAPQAADKARSTRRIKHRMVTRVLLRRGRSPHASR